jgi:hypothetical protein
MIFKVQVLNDLGWKVYDHISKVLMYQNCAIVLASKGNNYVVCSPSLETPSLSPYPEEGEIKEKKGTETEDYQCSNIFIPRDYNSDKHTLKLIKLIYDNGSFERVAYTGLAFILNDEGKTIERV